MIRSGPRVYPRPRCSTHQPARSGAAGSLILLHTSLISRSSGRTQDLSSSARPDLGDVRGVLRALSAGPTDTVDGQGGAVVFRIGVHPVTDIMPSESGRNMGCCGVDQRCY